jgi:hypothetical protein
MSKASTRARSAVQRVAIAALVGAIAFVLVNMTTESDQGLLVGIVASILAWLITAPSEQKSEKK